MSAAPKLSGLKRGVYIVFKPYKSCKLLHIVLLYTLQHFVIVLKAQGSRVPSSKLSPLYTLAAAAAIKCYSEQ